MPKVLAMNRDGRVCEVDAPLGQSLMQALKGVGRLDIEAVCGGNAICGTCHVYVDPQWIDRLPVKREDEAELLDQLVHSGPASRLSCQLKVAPDFEGLKVALAPEE